MDHNKMLIDATHPEETRVVVLKSGRVEEFDFESAARKLLRGNIYLAKVTRVEPSLQAAFVEYGGNRHGFLAFSEIHPDYYQIPVADRQALLEEEAAARRDDFDDERESNGGGRSRRRRDRRDGNGQRDRTPEAETGDGREFEHVEGAGSRLDDAADDASPAPIASVDELPPARGGVGEFVEGQSETVEADADAPSAGVRYARAAAPAWSEPLHEPLETGERVADEAKPAFSEARDSAHDEAGSSDDVGTAGASRSAAPSDVPEPHGLVEDIGVEDAPLPETIENGQTIEFEQVGSEDALEEVPERPRRRARSYKIQEVIKRRQIILVQVVKEERGTKGAALTTYLSLAGRYTVLMPNTDRGGGISRKITNAPDRKRLKAIADELEVPEGMGLIIRTAGAARTKQEIRRDFEYLLRLWESVREMTLGSTAPSLVYEEGDLIKRSIRDLYNKDTDEIIVAGEAAHGEALDFMRMLMPSQAESVRLYREPEPLFARYQIERQLNAMFSPYVTLRSGGYIVINQTEALVAIDVNSGKATREFSIEETALVTNMEAAEEIARQLRLRDLAGLIVIDFIDMEERRNNRKVEQRLKDALRHDRARIQVGRISHFGLLEMSRQRMRTGVLEGSTSQCPHCQGTGIIRSTESVALAVLRGLEDALLKDRRSAATAVTTAAVALYILNQKRAFILDMERRYGVPVTIEASERMQGANFAVERAPVSSEAHRRVERAAVSMEWAFPEEGRVIETDGDDDLEDEGAEKPAAREARPLASDGSSRAEEGDGRSRRRRRRRRGGRRDERPGSGEADDVMSVAGDEQPYDGHEEPSEASETGRAPRDLHSAERVSDEEPVAESDAPQGDDAGDETGSARRGRRRGRRGGRRTRGVLPGGENNGVIDPNWLAEPIEGEVTSIGFPSPDAPTETLVAVFDPASEPQPVIEAWPEQPDRARLARPRRPRGDRQRRDDTGTDLTADAVEGGNLGAEAGTEPSRPATPASSPADEPVIATVPVPETLPVPAAQRTPEPVPAPHPVPEPVAVMEEQPAAPAPVARAPRTADRIATIQPLAPSGTARPEEVEPAVSPPPSAPARTAKQSDGQREAGEPALEEAAMGPSPDASDVPPQNDAKAGAEVPAMAGDVAATTPPAEPPAPPQPTRRGWWQRRFSSE
jgi:ribonuclease E